MASVLVKLLTRVSLLAFGCVANEEATCASPTGAVTASLGQSLMQTQWHSAGSHHSKGYSHHSKMEPVGLTDRSKVTPQPKGSKLFLGSLVQLDEKGYQAILDSCCHLEMELFIRRLITKLGLELCNEVALLSLLPMHVTCEEGEQQLADLEKHIDARKLGVVPEGSCAMVASPGHCPLEQSGCNPDPTPASHRRRQCNAHMRRPSLGQEGQCVLPAGAVWCEVRLKNLQPYFMAVYDWNVAEDWVSYNVCQAGYWEESDMLEFGQPGSMLDIGGNIGYHTFAFARAGWNVTTFEPMAPNLALINASLCRNPDLAAKINVNPFGLGTSSQVCKMMAPRDNVGDGFTKCGTAGEAPAPGYKFTEIGNFSIQRLDQVLPEKNITQVDLVKIDVEGYEYQVFAGAPNFLTQFHPRLIKSELWYEMVGATGLQYLNLFETAGYKFFRDSKCQVPVDAKKEIQKGGMDVIMCL